jgi:hypothetical protein
MAVLTGNRYKRAFINEALLQRKWASVKFMFRGGSFAGWGSLARFFMGVNHVHRI